MARENYDACLSATLTYEGGYSNHPKDPGGATMRGVIQRVYDAYRKRRGLVLQSVRKISDAEVAEIYRTQYWDAVRGDDLPPGLDLCTFDGGVNSGPPRGVKWTQKALKVSQDGHMGEVTLSIARSLTQPQLIDAVKVACASRLSFLRGLSTWSTFGKGWLSRVTSVEARGMRMAGATPAVLQKEAADATTKAKKATQVATGAGGGGAVSSTAAASLDWRWAVVLLIVVVAAAAFAYWRNQVQTARAAALSKESLE